MANIREIANVLSSLSPTVQFMLVALLIAVVLLVSILVFLLFRLLLPAAKGFTFNAGDTEINFKINQEGAPLTAKFEHKFQTDFFESRQLELMENIRQLTCLDYKERLDWEMDFLKRIISLSQSADFIYAITLTSISHFWTKEKHLDGVVSEYLQSQPSKGTKRLFVVGNTAELEQYEATFSRHYQHYGQGGRIFLTNQQSYLKFLDYLCGQHERTVQLLNSDFGVWGFNRGTLKLYAELRPPALEFRSTDNATNPPPIDIEKLEKAMDDDFAIITEEGTYNFYRWTQHSSIDEARSKLFPKDDHSIGMVRHLVLMRHEDKDVLRKISGKVVDLNKIAEEEVRLGNPLRFKQSYAWWGECVQSLIGQNEPFVDGKFGGKLCIESEFSHLMILDLPSIEDLRKYYKNLSHSDVRRDVYTKLVDGAEEIYKQLPDLSVPVMAERFEELEETVRKSGKLRRMDFAEVHRHS